MKVSETFPDHTYCLCQNKTSEMSSQNMLGNLEGSLSFCPTPSLLWCNSSMGYHFLILLWIKRTVSSFPPTISIRIYQIPALKTPSLAKSLLFASKSRHFWKASVYTLLSCNRTLKFHGYKHSAVCLVGTLANILCALRNYWTLSSIQLFVTWPQSAQRSSRYC